MAELTEASEDKTLGILVHLGGLFTSWVIPLIIYLIKKGDGDTFTVRNAREALNFQITVFIGLMVSFILAFILIGIFIMWAIGLFNLIFCILAAVKASNGEVYRYPLTLRLIK